MVALNALNTQRETLRNDDAIRLHGILTRGGAAVNSIPADVRYEGRVADAIPVALWLSDDTARVPLAFSAETKLGTISLELENYDVRSE